MSLKKEIEKIHKAYQDADGENKAQAIAQLAELHRKVAGDAAQQGEFAVDVAEYCGGAYIPYVFWTTLGRFWTDESQRTVLQQLIRAFLQSDFDEEEQSLLRPLLVVYFQREREFEVSRARTQAESGAHPAAKEWLEAVLHFHENNKVAARTYTEKFALLHKTMPNFALFNLPLAKLEEALDRA